MPKVECDSDGELGVPLGTLSRKGSSEVNITVSKPETLVSNLSANEFYVNMRHIECV